MTRLEQLSALGQSVWIDFFVTRVDRVERTSPTSGNRRPESTRTAGGLTSGVTSGQRDLDRDPSAGAGFRFDLE
jgi:hypothetical protein